MHPESWGNNLEAGKELQDRFSELLFKIDDIMLIILKGHLLIEEQLNAMIDGILPNPQALKRAKLGCFERIQLAKALTPHNSLTCFDAFEKLNNIRNQYAHNIEPPKIDDKISKFIKYINEMREQAYPSVTKNGTKIAQLVEAIGFVSGMITGQGKALVAHYNGHAIPVREPATAP
jgi:hypothetical protein